MIPETDYDRYKNQNKGCFLDFDSNPEGFERCTSCLEPSEELEDGLCPYCYKIGQKEQS